MTDEDAIYEYLVKQHGSYPGQDRFVFGDTQYPLGDGNEAVKATVYTVDEYDNVHEDNIEEEYFLVVVDRKVYANEELDALRSEYDDDFLALERIRAALAYVTSSPLNHFKLTEDQVDALTFNELAGHLQSLAADFRDAHARSMDLS